MSRRAAVAALLVVSATAGCIDFTSPTLPQPGPAFLQAYIHLQSNGLVQLDAQLLPGLAPSLEYRGVPDDSLHFLGRPIAPKSVQRNGNRVYSAAVQLPAPDSAITVQPPVVLGIAGTPPVVRWYGIRRLDPDTVALPPGGDLYLHVDPVTPAEQPAPTSRQWDLELYAGGRSFHLGANGGPPALLHVPVEFLPADSLGPITASLFVLQLGTAGVSGGDYGFNLSMDQYLYWTVVRTGKGTP